MKYAFVVISLLPSLLWAGDVSFFCWMAENAKVQTVVVDDSTVVCNYTVLCEPLTDLFQSKVQSKLKTKFNQASDQQRVDAIADYVMETGNRLGKISNLYCKGQYKNKIAQCDPLAVCQAKAVDVVVQDPPQMGNYIGTTVRDKGSVK